MKKVFLIVLLFIGTFFLSIENFLAKGDILKTETDDKIIFIKDKDGSFDYSWTFFKNDLKEKNFDFDKEIEFKTKRLYDLDKLTGDNKKKKLLLFKHQGDLPGKAKIKVFVADVFNDEDNLLLYSYDEENQKIEKIKNDLKVINGYVSFDIDYCTNYFVALDYDDGFAKSKNIGIIITGMIIVVIGLVGYIMFKNQN